MKNLKNCSRTNGNQLRHNWTFRNKIEKWEKDWLEIGLKILLQGKRKTITVVKAFKWKIQWNQAQKANGVSHRINYNIVPEGLKGKKYMDNIG